MNIVQTNENPIINLSYVAIVMLLLPLVSLGVLALNGSLAPIFIFLLMLAFGSVLIVAFSNKNEVFLKIKLFVFIFSLYLFYTLLDHYFLLSFYPNKLPFNYVDEKTLYTWSNFGLPYISGEKNFFDIFSVFELSEMSLHIAFTSFIGYLSILIDNTNSIIAQRILPPFLGGMLSVVLYSTLKYQFSDRTFALNATFAYSLLSAVFIYSCALLRDIDVALAYMVFFYIFLQKYTISNLILLFLVGFVTIYLRVESGMVLFGLILLYSHLYIRKLESRSIKLIFYILLMGIFSFITLLMFNKLIGMIGGLNESRAASAVAHASADSIAMKFNKLPFGISHIVKVLFGQILPFPFFKKITFPPYAISGIFWPFVFLMMLSAIMKKNIRVLIDEKVIYLLLYSFIVLLLMSGELLTRRMMSVYPVIYIVSLYAFISIPKNEMKKIVLYYLFSIISLNTFYYMIKL